MILTDKTILEEIQNGNILIAPFNRKNLGSNSYDVHLSEHIAVYSSTYLDSKKDNPIERGIIKPTGVILKPGVLYLCSTIESVYTTNTVPFIEGKSSTGRLGISIHATAGKGDVGFKGHLTLEVTVTQPVKVYAGMPIGQLIFFETKGECLIPYNQKSNAKYKNQPIEPQSSQMFRNFENARK